MKAGIVALVGGIVGGVGVLCFLVAFGTDYWLLASDDCGSPGLPGKTRGAGTEPAQANGTEVEGGGTATPLPSLTLLHEGFFWRCQFQADPSMHVVWAMLFTNQPTLKTCSYGYLFPLPVALGPVPHPVYDATAVFRGLWTIFIISAVVASLAGSFLLLCAVPFLSHKLYRAGGALLITAAFLFLTLVVLFVLWKELGDIRRYVLQERGQGCPHAHLEAHYGWSFMVAGAGIPLVLLSGMLFYCIGQWLRRQT